MMSAQGSTAKRMGMAALLLAASALLSRVLGFARDAIITASHGASLATDAYYAAFTLPDLMNYFLAGGTLSITFIPLFSSYVTRGDEEGGWRLFSAVATTMGGALVVCTALGMWLTPWAVQRLNPGFEDAEQLALAAAMTRVVLPAQLAFYIGGLLQATLFVREVFWTAAVAPLIYNLCIILGGVLLAPWLGIQGFAVGVLVGAFLGPLGMPLWASRGHIRYRPVLGWRQEGFYEFFKLSLPLMLGATLVTVDEWLLRYFGSMHPTGTITWLNHSRKLMMVLFGVIGQAAGQAALPYLTRCWHEDKHEEMGELLTTSLTRTIFLSLIASGGLAAIAQPLIMIIFMRGEFTARDAEQTAMLLVLFCAGMAAWSAQTIAVRGFYARRDTWTPMWSGSIVLACSLPIYWGLDATLGAAGLAIASAAGMILHVIVTLALYKRSGGMLELGRAVASLWRGALIGGLTYGAGRGASYVLLEQLGWGLETRVEQAVALLAQGGAGLVVLCVLCASLQPPELDVVLDKLKRRLRRLR
jgi:putative peptidoglycan lipid II flippase